MVLNLLTALGTAGFGTWLLNYIRERREARSRDRKEEMESEAARDTRRRQEDLDAIDHLNKIIERKDRDHEAERRRWEESRNLWEKDRNGLIRERDRVILDSRNLQAQVTAMADRLAIYQGVGPEGAERMDPVLAMEADGTIRWANDPAGTFLRYYPTVSMIGKPMTTVIPPERHGIFRSKIDELVGRLMSLPDNFPLRHNHLGQIKRRDGSTTWVCVLLNLFRVRYTCSKCGNSGWVAVIRAHLRENWESAGVVAEQPLVPLNSSDGADGTSVSVEPRADDQAAAVADQAGG